VREYLAALDESQAPPKSVSLTDPQARWTCAPGGPAFFAYSTNYLIDVEHGVIVDVEATPANRSYEVESTKRMIERVEATFALKPDRLIGDMAYGGAPMLAWLVDEKGIEPHVPSGTRPSAPTARSRAATSCGRRPPTSIAVREGNRCEAGGVRSVSREAALSPWPAPFSTARAIMHARTAR